MMCGGGGVAAAAAAWSNPIIITTASASANIRRKPYPDCLLLLLLPRRTNTTALSITTSNCSSSSRSYSSSFYLLFIKHNSTHYYHPSNNLILMQQWQHCKVKMDVQVPISVAYKCYSDREAIPKWMPFISTVKILEDKPDLSRWSLKYKAFGQDIEFSWLARNMQPIPNQKIHWRSLEGLPNRGVVRFYPKGPSSCTIELTVSYEVPQLLVPVASALQPFLESLLARGLERFAKFAGSYSTDPST